MAKRKSAAKKAVEHVERKNTFIPLESKASIYTNSAQLSASTFDLRISFGEVVRADANEVVSHERVRVIMSLEHAKSLLLLLGEHIKRYEERFGPIRWPPKSNS